MGHTITPRKRRKMVINTKHLQHWEHSAIPTALNSFHGMCIVYHRFVSNCSRVPAPLIQLLKESNRQTYNLCMTARTIRFKRRVRLLSRL